MAVNLTDAEIAALIAEPKPLPDDYHQRVQTKAKRGHRATERYQQSGLREDSFAEPTTRYQDLAGALLCLIQDCGFQMPPNNQSGLFDAEGAP